LPHDPTTGQHLWPNPARCRWAQSDPTGSVSVTQTGRCAAEFAWSRPQVASSIVS